MWCNSLIITAACISVKFNSTLRAKSSSQPSHTLPLVQTPPLSLQWPTCSHTQLRTVKRGLRSVSNMTYWLLAASNIQPCSFLNEGAVLTFDTCTLKEVYLPTGTTSTHTNKHACKYKLAHTFKQWRNMLNWATVWSGVQASALYVQLLSSETTATHAQCLMALSYIHWLTVALLRQKTSRIPLTM